MEIGKGTGSILAYGAVGVIGLGVIVWARGQHQQQSDNSASILAGMGPLFQSAAIPAVTPGSTSNAAGGGISMADVTSLFSTLAGVLGTSTVPPVEIPAASPAGPPNFGAQILSTWQQLVGQYIGTTLQRASTMGGANDSKAKGSSTAGGLTTSVGYTQGQLPLTLTGALNFIPNLLTGGGAVDFTLGPQITSLAYGKAIQAAGFQPPTGSLVPIGYVPPVSALPPSVAWDPRRRRWTGPDPSAAAG